MNNRENLPALHCRLPLWDRLQANFREIALTESEVDLDEVPYVNKVVPENLTNN